MKESFDLELNEYYRIHRYKNCKLYWLQYYRFGKDYIPVEIYADEDVNKVYQKYLEMA